MEWKTIVDLIEKCSSFIAILLNSFLIYLIINKSPKQLGSYKYLLLYISWFEILYSILSTIVSPIIFSSGSIFIVMAHPKFYQFSRTLLVCLHTIWCGMFGSSMAVFALNFIYRYLVASGSHYLKTFDDYRIIYWMSVPLILGTTWGTIALLLTSRERTNKSIRNEMLETFDWNIDEIVYTGPYIYEKLSDGTYKTDIQTVTLIIILFLIMTSSISTMIFCGIKCYRKLNVLINKRDMRSKNFNRLQSQLLYALITQTIIPIILMHCPVTLLLAVTLLDRNLGTLSSIITITIVIFPLLDPIPTIFIIKSYRDAVANVIKVIFVKKHRTRNKSSSIEMN